MNKCDHPLRILQVSTTDVGGGAEFIAQRLFKAYREHGVDSWLAVGRKQNEDPHVLHMIDYPWHSIWVRSWRRFQRKFDVACGLEDFRHPGSWRLLDMLPERPDIVHCHNLHGGYFDLRALPWLSAQRPVVLTLHDEWALAGHCAYTLDCGRWRTGCGQCPYPELYPAISHDGTAWNWQRKRRIYEHSRLFVATPSQWLLDEVTESMLAPAIVEARVIYNGVDLACFRPDDPVVARQELGLQGDVPVLLFAANGIRRHNEYKDYRILRAAVESMAAIWREKIVFLALGEDARAERIGRAEIRFVPFQRDPAKVARYYQGKSVV